MRRLRKFCFFLFFFCFFFVFNNALSPPDRVGVADLEVAASAVTRIAIFAKAGEWLRYSRMML